MSLDPVTFQTTLETHRTEDGLSSALSKREILDDRSEELNDRIMSTFMGSAASAAQGFIMDKSNQEDMEMVMGAVKLGVGVVSGLNTAFKLAATQDRLAKEIEKVARISKELEGKPAQMAGVSAGNINAGPRAVA